MPYDPLMRWENEGGAIQHAHAEERDPSRKQSRCVSTDARRDDPAARRHGWIRPRLIA
jgi:hypothetical protein